jgi:hypothetical protein
MGSMLSMQWPATVRQRRAARPLPFLPIVAGALHEWRGRVSVLHGIIFHDDSLRAIGYRQQLVGVLQRLWRRDRPSVEAWVDSLLRRGAAIPPPARPTWPVAHATPPAHQLP